MNKIGIIGAGAWGTALAQALASEGREVCLWARESEIVESMSRHHENSLYLPGIKLDERIFCTDNLSRAAEADLTLIATPAQHLRATLLSIKRDIQEDQPVLICSKGIEIETGYLMSQVAHEIIPDRIVGVLTGPTFAGEIARGLPSAVTVAIDHKDIGPKVLEALKSRTLRPYITDDVIGAQIGGAVKNVIAIAAGAIEGRGMGESARAALVTRGLAEMSRLASAKGAKKETLMGMCGVGDLILTCSSMQSRNFSLGVALGKGQKLEDILNRRNSVTEGVHTSKAVMVMARNNAVEMPISAAVHACLNEGANFDDVIEHMLDRPVRPEAA